MLPPSEASLHSDYGRTMSASCEDPKFRCTPHRKPLASRFVVDSLKSFQTRLNVEVHMKYIFNFMVFTYATSSGFSGFSARLPIK